MTKYEVLLLVDANLDDESIQGIIKNATDLISKNQGEVENIDNWGRKKLAYLINKQGSAYYTLIYFSGLPETVKELDRVLKISDGIMRYMIVHRVETRQKAKAEALKAAQA